MRITADDPAFRQIVQRRYADFLNETSHPSSEIFVTIVPGTASDEDLSVTFKDGEWQLRRSDFDARWNPQTGRASARVVASPYAIDSLLRVMHTILLAREGGFLVHAASAIVNGRAYLFAGKSGAGKTTISRLAPPNASLLTDEISYVRRSGDSYTAYGTPFSGELAKPGENVSAPLHTLFLLEKGLQHETRPVSHAEALRSLLKNILFFSADPSQVQRVFEAASEFVCTVPVERLVFAPEKEVWELIA